MDQDECPEHVWRVAGVTLAEDVLADYECQRCGAVTVAGGDDLRGISPGVQLGREDRRPE